MGLELALRDFADGDGGAAVAGPGFGERDGRTGAGQQHRVAVADVDDLRGVEADLGEIAEGGRERLQQAVAVGGLEGINGDGV